MNTYPMRKRTRERIGADHARVWARELQLKNPYGKSILLAVANYMDENGAAFPGIRTISRDTDISEDVVGKRLRWLEEIGAIALLKTWRDENGVRNQEGRGQLTSSEIRFLFDADVEAINERAQSGHPDRPLRGAAAAAHGRYDHNHGENEGETVAELSTRPARVLNNDAPETPGSTSSSLVAPEQYPPSKGTKYPPGAGLIGLPEQEGSPLTPLPGGQAGNPSDQGSDDPLKEFREVYPDPVTDYQRALNVWSALSEDERKAALLGAKGYGAFIERERKGKRPRAVKAAHTWLSNRSWLGYIDAGKTAIATEARRNVDEGSEQWEAWTLYYQICGQRAGIPAFCCRGSEGSRVANLASEWPPVGRGVEKNRTKWMQVVRGTGQFAAWMKRLSEVPNARIFPSSNGGEQVLVVPQEWPPSKKTAQGDEAEASEV
jgi:hypothetical protein